MGRTKSMAASKLPQPWICSGSYVYQKQGSCASISEPPRADVARPHNRRLTREQDERRPHIGGRINLDLMLHPPKIFGSQRQVGLAAGMFASRIVLSDPSTFATLHKWAAPGWRFVSAGDHECSEDRSINGVFRSCLLSH
jgi:hypothetical protein